MPTGYSSSSLSELYDEREAASISSMVMEHLTGMPKSLRLLQKTDLFSARQEELFRTYTWRFGK